MITVLHNSRCSKSREALKYLEDNKIPFTVENIIENPPSPEVLKSVLKKLGMRAEDLLRKNEKYYKEQLKGKPLSEDNLLEEMSAHPNLIQRPVLINGDRAVIGRPAENIQEIL